MSADIVEADELARLLEPSGPLLLDVRWRLGADAASLEAEYRAGHLPGAVRVDVDRDLAAAPGVRGRHPLPSAGDFGAAMRALGVSGARPVVVYDDAGGLVAARAWWLLRHHGHPDTALLDGGLAAWVAAGGALEAGEVRPPPGDFQPGAGVWPVLDAAAAAALARRGVLLDARAGVRYRGEEEPVDRAGGHIPGALSAPTTHNLDDRGRFRDAAALRARFGALAVAPGSEVGVYCGSGVTAAHEILSLRLAGIDAALYPGSWSEWTAVPGRPVATGPEPG